MGTAGIHRSKPQEAPDWPVLLLALMMVMVPAMGVPSEELLQDTLKSILVSLFSLAAAFMFFFALRTGESRVRLHALMALPLMLSVCAMGGMLWSHTYLAGVEASRWLIFTVLVFLGANTLTLDRVVRLAWGINMGVVVASLWVVLQFWFDFSLFPQGAAPGSTFVNRNFFAEFLVCTLPFTAFLIVQTQNRLAAYGLVVTLGFNTTALLMTGTRSALVAASVTAVSITTIVWYASKLGQLKTPGVRQLLGMVLVFLATVGALGSIATGNQALISETGKVNAVERAFIRAKSIAKAGEFTSGSTGMRIDMWESSYRMIRSNSAAGVGAGNWESEIPRYQDKNQLLEADYYAHNEFLQMVAEYGVVGWIFLAGLALYLGQSAYATSRLVHAVARQEFLTRAVTLASLLALMLVSALGFPWRLASTGALFALCLGVLIASDIRLGILKTAAPTLTFAVTKSFRSLSLSAVAVLTFTAMFIAQQAIACESKLTRALKLALTISQSRDPSAPRWDSAKAQIVLWTREAVAINPHYRKLTPSIADALAGWGDWENACWIWESVVASRPNVAAVLANLARGQMHLGNFEKSELYLQRATALQPNAPLMKTLAVLLFIKTGQFEDATKLARRTLTSRQYDSELLRLSYPLGLQHQDTALAILALELRIKGWPNQAVDAWLKLGNIYSEMQPKEPVLAMRSYKNAVNASDFASRDEVLSLIPTEYRVKIH